MNGFGDGSISDGVLGDVRVFLDDLRDHFEGEVDVNGEGGPNFAMTVMSRCDVVAAVINRLMRSRDLARDHRDALEADVVRLREVAIQFDAYVKLWTGDVYANLKPTLASLAEAACIARKALEAKP